MSLHRGSIISQTSPLQIFAALEREQAQVVDDFALLVHDVVVLEQPLARLEVLQFDAPLRAADRARHQRDA